MSGGRRRIVKVGIQCDQCGCLLEKQGSPGYAINALADEMEASGWQLHTNPRDPGVWGPLISDRMPQTVAYEAPDLCPRCVLAKQIKDKLDPELLELAEAAVMEQPLEAPLGWADQLAMSMVEASNLDETIGLIVDETIDEPYDDYLDEADIRASLATKHRSS